jgi:hypothetical protein
MKTKSFTRMASRKWDDEGRRNPASKNAKHIKKIIKI